jgi:hypothetical protein
LLKSQENIYYQEKFLKVKTIGRISRTFSSAVKAFDLLRIGSKCFDSPRFIIIAQIKLPNNHNQGGKSMAETINLSINEEILLSLLRSGMMSPQQYYLETDGSVPDRIVQRAIAMTEDEYAMYLEQATRPDEAKLLINEAFLASSNFKFIELPIERLGSYRKIFEREISEQQRHSDYVARNCRRIDLSICGG